MLVNANLQRLDQAQPSLRLKPPEPMPESMLKRFPELREWDAKNMQIWKQNQEELARQIAIASQARSS